MNIKTQVLITALACSLLPVGRIPAGVPTSSASAASASLEALQSVDQLKARFNHDAGDVRLVLLLSPT